MDHVLIILSCAIYFSAALLQGLSGFGFSLLAIPLITLIMSPKTSVPILLIYSIIINIIVLISTKRALTFKKILPILTGALIALPLGTKLLIILPENIIRIFIGSFITLFGIILLTGFRFKLKHNQFTMVPIGFLSGLLSSSISIGGPPLIIYFTNQGTNKQEFRGNLAIYFFCLNLLTVPIYYINGLFTSEVINYSLMFSPALLFGVVTGSLISHRLKEIHFRKLVLYLLIIMGLTTLISVIT